MNLSFSFAGVKKLPFFLIAIFMFSIIPGCDKDNSKEDAENEFLVYMKESADQYRVAFGNTPPGVFLAVYTPASFSFYDYGFTQDAGADMHFRGASTTKSFTAASLLWLHQNGMVDIDDLVTDLIPGRDSAYLPNTPLFDIPNKSEITIRLLLSHRAGVFDVTNDILPDTIDAPYAGLHYLDYLQDQQGVDHSFTTEDLLIPLAEHQLSYFEPDAAMHYSNSGYHLLGVIVERVSGMSLSEFKQTHFLTPLGMENTKFDVNGADNMLSDPAFDCYLLVGGDVLSGDIENLSLAYADGNIVTTARDLATWAYHLWGTHDILNAEMLEQMTNGMPTGEHHVTYGLGCEMHPPEIGVGHNGARRAFMTVMRYHPTTQKSYIAVSNSLNADDFQAEGDMLFGLVEKAIELEL